MVDQDGDAQEHLLQCNVCNQEFTAILFSDTTEVPCPYCCEVDTEPVYAYGGV